MLRATIKIHSKEYLAPCRLPSVQCHCDGVATFYQSKKNNLNMNRYFFGCPQWKTDNCKYFIWCDEYRIPRNEQIVHDLVSSSLLHMKNHDEQAHKRSLEQDHMDNNDATRKRLECIICLSNERSFMISPCNHLCCCSICVSRIENTCPVCRVPIQSIIRIFWS